MANQARVVIRDPALAIALEIQEIAGLDSPSAAIALVVTTYGPALLDFLRNPLKVQDSLVAQDEDSTPEECPETTAIAAFDSL